MKENSANSVQYFEYPKNVWKRISMYLGDRGSQQTVAVREIIDNAVHEAVRGYADTVKIVFGADKSVMVQDNGRGLPTDVNTKTGKNGIVLTMATLHAGENFKINIAAGKAGAGLNGVGASCCNAVSKRFDVAVFKNNKKYSLSFRDGYAGHFNSLSPESDFIESEEILVVKDDRDLTDKKLFKTGTQIKFWFNEDRFPKDEKIDREDLINRLKFTAYIVPKLKILVEDHNQIFDDGSFYQAEFYSEYGIAEMAEIINQGEILPDTKSDTNQFTKKGIYSISTSGKYKEIATSEEEKSIEVERTVTADVVFCYNTGYEKNVVSFVNTIKTPLGGVHQKAFEKAFVKAFTDRMQNMRGMLSVKDEPPILDDFLEGLTAILSINVPEPQFAGQQKEKLSGPEVEKALYKAFLESFTKFVENNNNQKIIKPIFEKIITASKNRQAVAVAKLAKRKATQVASSSMPTKLADCDLTGTDESELHICLKGDTTVRLADGSTPTIESLVGEKDLNIISYDGFKKIETPVIEVFKTRDVSETLEIEFEDGSIVECTPEHLFLINGEWVMAKDIVEGWDIQDVN